MEYRLEKWLISQDHWEEAQIISDYVHELENRNFELANHLFKANRLLEARNRRLNKLKSKISTLEGRT